MNGIIRVIDALDKRVREHGERFHVTCAGKAGEREANGKFGSNNWPLMRVFAADLDSVGFTIRRFERETKGKVPLKSICGLFADKRGHVVLFNAQEMYDAMHTCSCCGEKLPPLDDFVRYFDARAIFPASILSDAR